MWLRLSIWAMMVFMLAGCSRESSSSVTQAPKTGINFQKIDFDVALAKAQSEGKPIFIDFYTTWCAPCKWMDKDVFTQKNVGDYFNKNFINLKVDAEKGEGPSLASRYFVSGFPTLVYLDSEGNLITSQLGMTTSDVVLDLARKSVEVNQEPGF